MTAIPCWQPSATLAALEGRARQLAWVRGFFARRGVMEVETPVLGRYGVTDSNIDSIPASPAPVAAGFAEAWLQTSPEYHMKRLLAAGAGPIYQVARVFRDGESGRRHNPEFSLLEWYRPGFTDTDLMAEVSELVCGWLGCEAPRMMRYRDVFLRFAGVDPFLATDSELAARCEQWLAPGQVQAFSRDDCLDLLMGCQVEPALASAGPVFVTGYPESQAALARVSEQDGLRQAHRFELYVQGVELCNGYWELTDWEEQQQRFAADNQARASAGKPEMPVDKAFLAALQAGVPDCAGVALGLDRLLMLKLGLDDLAGVIAFPADRA
ncbi:EF-P lysine aminoacylase EpmA [Marinobacter orientalis]|uniref:EF-P lysine aminoacylase GenX n=1 Tax=Marinobacter orientalis TaxID=1928859 RepID=A0A7Y0RFT5_9GAMM|nr:EF-P lysine aminoacylase EpmA [Marinobacter orientalis]NMT65466.1 EF-P lysine aminoacylase GenX [Marinobacter orientalis]TGX47370.1 EF-P lysine aminoacylase GenX [Marinobacter orientalis]